MCDDFDDDDLEGQEDFVSQEEYEDAVIEDSVRCRECGTWMQVGDNDCLLAGHKSICVECAERKLAELYRETYQGAKSGDACGYDGEPTEQVKGS